MMTSILKVLVWIEIGVLFVFFSPLVIYVRGYDALDESLDAAMA